MGQCTVGDFLVRRLEQLGLKHAFGVPGDYVMGFMDIVLNSTIQLVGTCSELNGGYAADGYARMHGLGCLIVTYNVGSFSAYNAVAGAYAEDVPLVVISGAPSRAQARQGLPMHHLVQNYDHQKEIYRHITVASVVIDHPDSAAQRIDKALIRCLQQRKPVFIELPMDMVSAFCEPGREDFCIVPRPSNVDALSECVQEAICLLSASRNPAVLAGAFIDRDDLRGELLRLLNSNGYQTAVTMDAVGTLSPGHSCYRGIYQGRFGTGDAQSVIESADCLLFLGVRRTDITTGGFTGKIDKGRLIKADPECVQIGHHVYKEVFLRDFLPALVEALPAGKAMVPEVLPNGCVHELDPLARITSARFFDRLNQILGSDTIVVSDTGDAFFQTSQMPGLDRYVNQSYYLSIGYSLPAALGVALAEPKKRTLLVIGDGAFQMTAQELSTIIRLKVPMLIFLINNDGYVIERMLHHEAPYNDINRWNYADLPRIFGGCPSARVETERDLEAALTLAEEHHSEPVFVEIFLERNDCAESLRRITELVSK